LVGDDPKAFAEEDEQEEGGEPLRASNVEARTFHAAVSAAEISFALLGSNASSSSVS
jgi:hypothetical protein